MGGVSSKEEINNLLVFIYTNSITLNAKDRKFPLFYIEATSTSLILKELGNPVNPRILSYKITGLEKRDNEICVIPSPIVLYDDYESRNEKQSLGYVVFPEEPEERLSISKSLQMISFERPTFAGNISKLIGGKKDDYLETQLIFNLTLTQTAVVLKYINNQLEITFGYKQKKEYSNEIILHPITQSNISNIYIYINTRTIRIMYKAIFPTELVGKIEYFDII